MVERDEVEKIIAEYQLPINKSQTSNLDDKIY